MAIVSTSPRTFLFASGLMIAFNGVIAAMSIASVPESELPTPDRAFQNFCAHNVVFIGLLITGHLLLKKRSIGTRASYAAMGGLCAMLAYALAVKQGLLIKLPFEGTRLTAGIIPTTIGMLVGTLYVHFAGYESNAGAAIGRANIAMEPEATPPAPVMPSVFDGPVQVRTSLAATILAAAVPAILVALTMMLYFGMVSVVETAGKPTRSNWSIENIGLVFSGYLFVVALIVTIIPGSIAIQIAHGMARAIKRTDYVAYSSAGAGVGLVGAILLMVIFPIPPLGVLLLVAGPIMGAVYRRVAGIEPLALPEVILATDRRTLVGADDPARRTHTVIMHG